MQIDYLIIGQGISGTWLSYYLQNEGKSFVVIDTENKNSPSRVSAGIINPVTGRRHVEVWMAEEILPFAHKAYQQIGHELKIDAISQKNIIDFFPSPQMRASFMQRVEEKNQYVHSYPDQNNFNQLLNYDFGCGEIKPVYIAHVETLLPAWRELLKDKNCLLEEAFDINNLEIKKDGIRYNGITANKIIFCDGNSSSANRYFNLLPFAPNKGEIVIAEIPGLPATHIYKKGMMMVPLAVPGQWWIGSNYAWKFDDAEPTTAFRQSTERLLKEWLKIPFTITQHLSSIRPATLERRPFVGIHPQNPGMAILNGMGTKGCSLAPYFAKQLVDHLVRNRPINPEVSVERFSKILSRNS